MDGLVVRDLARERLDRELGLLELEIVRVHDFDRVATLLEQPDRAGT